MPENLFRRVSDDISGLEMAQAYPLEDDAPFFLDIIRMKPGASTAVHGQAGDLCYRLTAITPVSGLSLFENDKGQFDVNGHVYLEPGEFLERPRGFRHKFVNTGGDNTIFAKSLPPSNSCPLREERGFCVCRGEK